MVKINELRVGNWLITGKSIPQKVAYITLETIGFENETGGTDKHQKNPIFSYDIEKIQLIILTPEILEKFGFEKHRSNEYTLDLGGPDKWLSISFYKKGIFPVLYTAPETQSDFGGYFACNMIESLHELQNLIHALTGEEFEVSL